jgi:lipopolysaccharide biosynthesis regulator YciM
MLTQDLIPLLLPLAAASGWYFARRYYTRRRPGDAAHSLTQAYRRGLNYLLDEKTDEAIAAVARILEQDSEPLDIHIALGNFFRRRGEVEKAIEIHRRLLQEQDLTGAQRAKANFELGMDYMRSGLFDRAETIFLALTETGTHGTAALRQLLQIYQQQKDWKTAIDCIVKLRGLVKPKHGETAAHFYCELAEEAKNQHRLKDARDYLAKALKDDPGCVRASLAKGRLELGNGEYRQAMETLKSIESQNPLYLPVALPLIRQCAERQMNKAELGDYLDHLYENFGIGSATVERAEQIRGGQGVKAALDYLLTVLEKTSDAQVLIQTLILVAEHADLGAENFRKLRNQILGLLESQPPYQCRHCGYAFTELYWRCPSCQHWDSIIPKGSELPSAD